MGVERLSTRGGESNPGSGLPVEASLLDAHDFFFRQCCQILRQRGVRQFDDNALLGVSRGDDVGVTPGDDGF